MGAPTARKRVPLDGVLPCEKRGAHGGTPLQFLPRCLTFDDMFVIPRILAVPITLALIAIGHAQSETIPATAIDSIKSIVVPILCVKRNDEKKIISLVRFGSGFFLNREGHFITAEHVIDKARSSSTVREPCDLAVGVPRTAWKLRSQEFFLQVFEFSFRRCAVDSVVDLAVCKPDANPFQDEQVKANLGRVAGFGSIKNYEDGTSVAFTGFPIRFTTPLTTTAHLAGYFPGDDLFVLDTTNWGGASGSPIYDREGRVLGILLMRSSEPSAGLTYGRPADSILTFLSKHKIPLEK